ncbi:glutathione S-transferase [Hypoxylon sp. FL1150]|nr:glutathione S-transferase [Hypoxylon sp. FL1150]
MALGTLYIRNPSARTPAILAIAKEHGIELDIVHADTHGGENYDQLIQVNSLAQIPVFVGPDGFVLTECIPIALYITGQIETTTLLGSNQREYYQIIQWMSMVNSEMVPNIGGVMLPLLGRPQPVRKNSEDCLRRFHIGCKRLDTHLQRSRYLVGDQVTLADLFSVGAIIFAVKIFHKVLEARYPRLFSWFHEVYEIPMFKEIVGEFEPFDMPVPMLPEELAPN